MLENVPTAQTQGRSIAQPRRNALTPTYGSAHNMTPTRQPSNLERPLPAYRSLGLAGSHPAVVLPVDIHVALHLLGDAAELRQFALRNAGAGACLDRVDSIQDRTA